MFRLFQQIQEKTPSPSLLSRALETAKELSPVEFCRPSFRNFTNNSYLIFSLIAPAAANWVCFKMNDIPYSFVCSRFVNGYDLQGHLVNLLNQSCAIVLTNTGDCLYYRNSHEYFGSSGYGKSLCELGYPRMMTPDSCIIGNLQNNTPTHKFGTVNDVKDTVIYGLVGGLMTIGLFTGGACLLKKHLNAKNNITDPVLDEEASLNPKRPSLQ